MFKTIYYNGSYLILFGKEKKVLQSFKISGE